jgi:Na+/melibiose symporter-like transporter
VKPPHPPLAAIASFSAAHLASAFGFEFLTFVMTVRIYEMTGQAMDVGVFAALSFVPRLLSPLYGSLTDHCSRRWLFCLATLAMAGAVVMLARQSSLPAVYAVWFVIAILAMIVLNVRNAIMMDVMPDGQYSGGNAVMLVSLNAARLVAPFAGGIIAARWSATAVLSVAACAYGVAAAMAFATRLPERAPGAPTRSGLWSDWRQGMVVIWHTAELRLLAGVVVIWRLCLGFQASVLVVYVAQGFGRGALEFGVMTAASAIGSILGSLAGPALTRMAGIRVVMITGVGLHFILVGALGIIDDFALAAFDLAAANLLLYAAAVAVHCVRDTVTPDGCRGRVYGCITAITAAPALISMLAGGWLADVVGVRALFIAGAVAALALSSMLLVLSSRPFAFDAARRVG